MKIDLKLTSLHTGQFFMLLLLSADFFRIIYFKKFFKEHNQTIKQFESRSGHMSKLFANVISRQQKLPLARKEITVLLENKASVYLGYILEQDMNLHLNKILLMAA